MLTDLNEGLKDLDESHGHLQRLVGRRLDHSILKMLNVVKLSTVDPIFLFVVSD